MDPALGYVVFSTWQAILLILLCTGSLGIALYCLLFMVPLRSFVERINSLGGGVRGVRAHVDGVASQSEKRLAEVERGMRGEMQKLRAELDSRLEPVAAAARRLQGLVEQLERAVAGLHRGVADRTSQTEKVEAQLNLVRRNVGELKNDFRALQHGLEGSVRAMVANSCQNLESTVLGALEAIEDDMVRTSAQRPDGTRPPGRHRPAGGRGDGRKAGNSDHQSSGKIISPQSLFAETGSVKVGPTEDHKARPN